MPFHRSVGLACVVAAAACGGSAPEAKAPEPPPEPAKVEHHAPSLAVSSELGTIDQGATEKAFERLQPALMHCYESGQRHIEYMSGDVKFFLRIGQDGAIKWAYLQESTLGDRDTERCMLDTVTGARWPSPQGGEAEVQKAIGFDAPANVRAPAPWDTDRIAATLGKHGDDVVKCKAGGNGSFHITAYVVPAKKGEGKVHAVGVAPPNKDGEDKIDCIVDAVKKLKMPSPGSYAAKVSFIL